MYEWGLICIYGCDFKIHEMKKDVNDWLSIFQQQQQQEETTYIHTTIYQYDLSIQNTNTWYILTYCELITWYVALYLIGIIVLIWCPVFFVFICSSCASHMLAGLLYCCWFACNDSSVFDVQLIHCDCENHCYQVCWFILSCILIWLIPYVWTRKDHGTFRQIYTISHVT
jgi:hypothetical protein